MERTNQQFKRARSTLRYNSSPENKRRIKPPWKRRPETMHVLSWKSSFMFLSGRILLLSLPVLRNGKVISLESK